MNWEAVERAAREVLQPLGLTLALDNSENMPVSVYGIVGRHEDPTIVSIVVCRTSEGYHVWADACHREGTPEITDIEGVDVLGDDEGAIIAAVGEVGRALVGRCDLESIRRAGDGMLP